MSDDDRNDQICRDDDCTIKCIHRAHPDGMRRKRSQRRMIIVHHRPSKRGPLAQDRRPVWQRDAPKALTECVLKSVGEQPVMMQWIARDVRDDYGQVTDRTIYRHVRKLVREARLIKLDLGLAFAAYIRPKSRFLSDPAALRNYMLSNVECLPACTKESVA